MTNTNTDALAREDNERRAIRPHDHASDEDCFDGSCGPNPNALAKAVAYLGAVEVAPGRFAYYDLDGLKRWMTVSADTLDLINTEGSVQSAMTWLAMRDYAQVMPAWWSPESRFAVVYAGPITAGQMTRAFASVDEALAHKAFSDDRIITADLEAGAEVPA